MNYPARSDAIGRANTRQPSPPWRDLSPVQKGARVWGWVTLLIIVLGIFLFIHGSPLLDPLPPFWRAGMFIFGALNGIGACILIDQVNRSENAKIPAYLLFAFFSAFAFALITDLAVEGYGFTAFTPQTSQIFAPITSDAECHGYKNLRGPRLGVQPYAGARHLDVSVSHSTCEKFDAGKLDGHDCLLLDVETGRNLIKRVRVPALSTIGEDRLLRCPGY